MPRTSSIHRSRRKLPRAPRRPDARTAAPQAQEAAQGAAGAAAAPPATSKPQSAPDEGYVAVGRILAPFGLKGELKVQPLTDNPRRFSARSKLRAGTQPVTIVKSREAKGYVYVMLKGYTDRSSVDRFRHAMLQVPEDRLPPLQEGAFYRFQLAGLQVVDPQGAVIGTLEEVIETGANDVYRVRTTEGTDVLLPARDDVILSIDLATKRMVVDPPDWR